MRIFEAFKQYIIRHPKVAAYRPTSDSYDRAQLFGIIKKLGPVDMKDSKEELDKVRDFLNISDLAHKLYKDFYRTLEEQFANLGLKGEEISEYFIAFLNHDYNVVTDKVNRTHKNLSDGTYLMQDMTNQKLELPDGSKVDMRAAIEGETDATSLLCNYLRHHLNDEYKKEDADSNRFASTIKSLFEMAGVIATFKHSYDDVLYGQSFVKIDSVAKTILFDFDNYYNEKLKTLGQLIFGERVLHVYCQNRTRGRKSELEKYVKYYRVKKSKVRDGYITLEFGQGESKTHLEFMRVMQAAIDAYYEYLDINMPLENLGGIRLSEFLGVWIALQCMCYQISERWKVIPGKIYTKEEFGLFPRKMKASDLEAYLMKMTGVKVSHVRCVLQTMEVNWTKYNDIWTSPLLKIKGDYCLPFNPIVNSQPYNLIENIMQRGGYDLEKRGKTFEYYVYKQITEAKHKFEVKCIVSKKFGSKERSEEIDLLVVLRDIVVLAEAKCIHYSMEQQNYGDAWSRLKHGAEQARRKRTYIETHPEVLAEIGNVSNKRIIPVVLTNYPTFAGCEHEGVYVIDSHTFISYFTAGFMTMRAVSFKEDPIEDIRFFYQNETEMSANFEQYLREQPIKQIHVRKMVVEEIPQLPLLKSWKCTAKTAVYKGNPCFDISYRSGV